MENKKNNLGYGSRFPKEPVYDSFSAPKFSITEGEIKEVYEKALRDGKTEEEAKEAVAVLRKKIEDANKRTEEEAEKRLEAEKDRVLSGISNAIDQKNKSVEETREKILEKLARKLGFHNGETHQ